MRHSLNGLGLDDDHSESDAQALLMTMEVHRGSPEVLAEGFGERIVTWVADALAPMMEGLDEMVHWRALLAAFALASAVSQTLRLALLWGQLETTSEALWKWPFWAEEAIAMQGGDAALHHQEVSRRLGLEDVESWRE